MSNFYFIEDKRQRSLSSWANYGFAWYDFTEKNIPQPKHRTQPKRNLTRHYPINIEKWGYSRFYSYYPASGVDYSADFNTAQSIVAINEGGYQALPSDTGNYYGGQLIGTNYGISAPTLAAFLGRTPTVQDMKNLSYSDALSIYQANYWNPLGLNDVKNDSIASIIYDGAVNQGVAGIKKVVAPLLPSGIYNVADINAADPQTLFNAIKQARASYYTNLNNSKFLNSWLSRLNKFSFAPSIEAAETAAVAIVNKAINKINQNKVIFLLLGTAIALGIGIASAAGKKNQAAPTV